MGYAVKFPDNYSELCCGQMYRSSNNKLMQDKVQQEIKQAIKHTTIAIIDNSSCSCFARDSGLNLIDINQFIVQNIDKRRLSIMYQKIALHVDCRALSQSGRLYQVIDKSAFFLF